MLAAAWRLHIHLDRLAGRSAKDTVRGAPAGPVLCSHGT